MKSFGTEANLDFAGKEGALSPERQLTSRAVYTARNRRSQRVPASDDCGGPSNGGLVSIVGGCATWRAVQGVLSVVEEKLGQMCPVASVSP